MKYLISDLSPAEMRFVSFRRASWESKKVSAGIRRRFQKGYRSGSGMMDSLVNTGGICTSPEIDLVKSAF